MQFLLELSDHVIIGKDNRLACSLKSRWKSNFDLTVLSLLTLLSLTKNFEVKCEF